jgi:ABC-2 type transport system permease protein
MDLRKSIDVTLKDLMRYTRSMFVLVMMFGAPLLIAGLIYFAFSGLGSSEGGFQLPVTRVQLVNLDQPGSQYGGFSAGKALVEFLQTEQLAELLKMTVADDEASARAAVEGQEADVAVIIPADLSHAAFTPGTGTEIAMYQDPTLIVGPAIVKGLINNFLDGFSGSQIAAGVTAKLLTERGGQSDPATIQSVVMQYADWAQRVGGQRASGPHPLIEVQSPPRKAAPTNQLADLAGKILAGQLIFFSFYTAASTAQSIITEEEQMTLPRLFTTPTPRTAILAGKFICIFVLVLGQAVVLTVASAVIFHIRWGQPLTFALVTLGLVAVSSGLGLFLMSFVRSSRQAGLVLGAVLTVLGMAGGLFSTGMDVLPRAFETVALFTPHGWVLRGWKLSLAGAGPGDVLLPVAVVVAMGIAFFTFGAVSFRRRLA